MKATIGFMPLLLCGLLLLASCESDVKISDVKNEESVAGGGIGGTGKGTVTGYTSGNIIVDATRQFIVNSDTQISLDDTPTTAAALENVGPGLVTRLFIGPDVSADFTSGTALNVVVDRLVVGPVTRGAPNLEALDQKISVDEATVLDGIANIGALAPGDIVAVSGYADGMHAIAATRLARLAGGAPVWKLSGRVSSVTPGTSLLIGTQQVNIVGVPPSNCGPTLDTEDTVEIYATENAGFTSGAVLTNVLSLACVSTALEIPPDYSQGQIVASMEGFVLSVTLPSFNLDGQNVAVSAQTNYFGGGPDDIAPGSRLVVDGTLSTATGILTAQWIYFKKSQVHMTAPVATVDIVTGQSLRILGLTVYTTVHSVDLDNTISGRNGDAQVRVLAYIDAGGLLYATNIRHTGAPDINDVDLKGKVSGLPGPPFVSVFGINVNTTGAQLLNADKQVISAGEFFAAIAIGTKVKLTSGTYDNSANTISAVSSIKLGE